MTPAIASLFDLRGRTAIVTAAGQGMGYGIARRLAEAGANIVVSHRHRDAGEATAAELRGLGVGAVAVLADVTDLEALDDTVTAAMRTLTSSPSAATSATLSTD